MPKPSRTRAAALTAAALLPALVAGCARGPVPEGQVGPVQPGPVQGGLSGQKLAWENCPPPSEAEGGGSAPAPLPDGTRWQCATMKAPLNWNDPSNGTIDIALIRAKAGGAPSQRIGSLVFNFGGPGGSGVSSLPAFAPDYATLRTRYDLVSFDPRGVGRSAGVKCKTDQQLDKFFQQDATPTTPAEQRTFLNNIKQFNSGCEQHSGRLLPYLRTTDTARDMDLMRQLLGDRKLYYFGISYGTELGGVYAHLFPTHVGRAVFDAVVDPTQTPDQLSLGQARGFQLAFDNYARDCVARSAGCPVGRTVQDVQNRITALLKELDRKPLPGAPSRQLTRTAATNGIVQALYSKNFWPYLTEGLELAYMGDGRLLMLLSDTLNGRNEDGRYSNLTAANVAINCADEKPRYTTAEVRAKLPGFRAVSPLFGDLLAWSLLSCANWPVQGAAYHPDVSAPGAPPILVVGNTGDPATPYEGARRMAIALGKGVGVQLTYKGQGHGAYNSKNVCVQNTVNRYLLDGKVPPNGTVCS
ncbi:alpha/beta hydrolase [Streptomyces sp. RY43-2]|uniref:Alpha/beta hydrolase n=1 Tax=Streptomyces macrolidinus TaxID=2952607 RepID=A0ABT0ZAZ2_9ACTN|nr:alpha/beta hydrolase [Streptomyces macrolidinus]MCN9239986.1 alpha/beta hydrolase [Streptomyces macrolidinus]